MREPLRFLPPVQTMKDVVAEVAERRGIDALTLRGPSARRPVVRARWEAFHLCRNITRENGRPKYSLPQIGKFFGRDHTTVLYGLRQWSAASEAAE